MHKALIFHEDTLMMTWPKQNQVMVERLDFCLFVSVVGHIYLFMFPLDGNCT